MPMPRPATLGSILPFLLGGAMPPMASPPIAGASVTGGQGYSSGSPRMHSQEGPNRMRGPLAGLRQAQPLGGVLTDTLPDLRLEPMPQPNLAAMSQPQGGVDPLAPKPGMDKKALLGGILGALGDGMMAYGGLQPAYLPALLNQQEGEREDSRWRERLSAEIEAKRQERLHPRIEQVGNSIGWLDPSAGQFQSIFTAPQNFEIYARELGLTPGTPEYVEAIKEFRAGTWNDAGVEGRLTVQRPRLEQSNTNNIRSTSTSRANSIRATGQSDRNNIRSTGQSDANSRRSAETTRSSAAYQGRGKGGARAELNGRPIVIKGGRWVDEATGKPVE